MRSATVWALCLCVTLGAAAGRQLRDMVDDEPPYEPTYASDSEMSNEEVTLPAAATGAVLGRFVAVRLWA